MLIPRELQRGERVTADYLKQVIRYMRDLARKIAVLELGRPTVRTNSVTAVGALQLTLEAPVGWSQPEGQEGTPVFVTWGTAGGVMPALSVFADPVGYVQEAGVRYVWAKIGVSAIVSTLATSIAFVSSTNAAEYVTGNFDASGNPPAYLYVPLGYIQAVGPVDSLAINLSNSGSGSIVPTISVTENVVNGMVTGVHKQLVWWRTDV